MRSKLVLIILSSFIVFGYVQAQNPLTALFSGSAGSEERLLYKKPAGTYEITIDGERLLERAYFRMDIRENGVAISPDSVVTLEIVPPARANSTTSTYTAIYDEPTKRFVVDPITLEASGNWDIDNWMATVDIQSTTGDASMTFGTQVYAPKPKQNTMFSIINIVLPLITLALFLGVFALRGIRLEQVATT